MAEFDWEGVELRGEAGAVYWDCYDWGEGAEGFVDALRVDDGDGTIGGREAGRCATVADYGVRCPCASVEIAATCWRNEGAEVVVGCWLIGGHHNIISLSDGDGELFGLVGNDGHKISGDDSEGVSIKLHLEVIVDTIVDDAHEMFLAGLELERCSCASRSIWLDVLAVDQVIGGSWRSESLSELIRLKDGQRGVPVADHDGAQIDVIVGRGRSVDNHRTQDTGTVLGGEVCVIPCCAILSGLETVCLSLTRCNRTLSDTRHAIFRIGIQLSEAVPVDASAIGLEVVVHSDFDPVTPVGLQEGTRVLAVDDEHLLWCAIGRQSHVRDAPIKTDCSESRRPPFRHIGVDVEARKPITTVLRTVWQEWEPLCVFGGGCFIGRISRRRSGREERRKAGLGKETIGRGGLRSCSEAQRIVADACLGRRRRRGGRPLLKLDRVGSSLCFGKCRGSREERKGGD